MKKRYIIIGLIIGIILVIGIFTNYLDSGRVSTGHEPKYCLKLVNKDGSKVTYWGLGYKVIRYVSVSPKEPYKSNIGVKMGSWFMKYEIPIDSDKEKDITINNLDDFYNTTLTKDNDLRNLSQEYSPEDAEKDNCFISGISNYNEHLASKFMEDYQNKNTAFIRVGQTTTEGDLILYDILYHKKTNKIYLVIDNTRDKFSSKEDRIISLKEYSQTSYYDYEDTTYWVLSNENITDELFNTNNIFVVATVNK